MKLSSLITLGLYCCSISLAQAEEMETLHNSRSLTPEAALEVAKAAIDQCRADGFMITAAVTDNAGNLQVLIRDRLAGAQLSDAAINKAVTAINFRTSTATLTNTVNNTPSVSGIKHLPGLMILGGGLPIEASGSVVGAIGVSGAPDGKMDEKCASAGITAIQEALDFAD